jgi:stage II sporulation protein AA (anti-sigma F factor antagonist)
VQAPVCPIDATNTGLHANGKHASRIIAAAVVRCAFAWLARPAISSLILGISFMKLVTEKTGETLVVCPEGQINSANAGGIEAELLGQVEKGERKVVLDFSGLDYISSAGLRVVLLLAKRLKQQAGSLVLCGMQPHVHEVFDISGFLGILTVVDTRAAALAKIA